MNNKGQKDLSFVGEKKGELKTRQSILSLFGDPVVDTFIAQQDIKCVFLYTDKL